MPLSKYEVCKKVIKEQQYTKVNYITKERKNKRLLLDYATANVIVKVMDAISSKRKIGLNSFNWLKLQSICFKCLK